MRYISDADKNLTDYAYRGQFEYHRGRLYYISERSWPLNEPKAHFRSFWGRITVEQKYGYGICGDGNGNAYPSAQTGLLNEVELVTLDFLAYDSAVKKPAFAGTELYKNISKVHFM